MSTVTCTTTGCNVNGNPVQTPSNGIIHITCVNGQCSVDNQGPIPTSNTETKPQSTTTGLVVGIAIAIAIILLGIGIYFAMNKGTPSPRLVRNNFRNVGGEM